jgi:hypothetical protein
MTREQMLGWVKRSGQLPHFSALIENRYSPREAARLTAEACRSARGDDPEFAELVEALERGDFDTEYAGMLGYA